MDEALRVLKQVFGHSSFKSSLQEEAIKVSLKGDKDIFVAMPTGAGKSLCYQLPAVVKGGVTLVISPLIALMKDQLDHLKDLGIRAATINSKQSQKEKDEICLDLKSASPETRLLYVTPEQVATKGFREIAAALKASGVLRYLVVDEAHCVSEWGHDFRPDYARLGAFRTFLAAGSVPVPCLALTATASQRVADDVCSILRLRQPIVNLRTSSFRSNLYYDVRVKELLEDPYADLARFATEALGLDEGKPAPADWTKAGCGIVYCRTREACTEVANRLSRRGMPSRPYHAGLPADARNRAQTEWTDGKLAAVAATISFGMGIDKADVRFVAHWTIPKSMAGYYQESGRAGRDGRPSYCRLYYSRQEKSTVAFLIQQENQQRQDSSKKRKKGMPKDDNKGPDEAARVAKVSEKNFEAMVDYCEKPRCRHELFCAYFGDPKPPCKQMCDFCSNRKEVEAQLNQLQMCAFATSHSRDKGRRSAVYFTTADIAGCDDDMYGGGRQGAKRDYEGAGDEDAEPSWYKQQKVEQEQRKERRSLIEHEFEKRRGAARAKKASASNEDCESDLNSNHCPLKARQATGIKVLNLTVKTREQYFELLRSALAANASSALAPRKVSSAEHASEPEVEAAAALEYEAFSKCATVDSYRMAVAKSVTGVKKATKLYELHPSIAAARGDGSAPGGPSSGGSGGGIRQEGDASAAAAPRDESSSSSSSTGVHTVESECSNVKDYSYAAADSDDASGTCKQPIVASQRNLAGSDGATATAGASHFVTAAAYLKEMGDSEPWRGTSAQPFKSSSDAALESVADVITASETNSVPPAAKAGVAVQAARAKSQIMSKRGEHQVPCDAQRGRRVRATGHVKPPQGLAATTLTEMWHRKPVAAVTREPAHVDEDMSGPNIKACEGYSNSEADKIEGAASSVGSFATAAAPASCALSASQSRTIGTSNNVGGATKQQSLINTKDVSAVVVRYLTPYYGQKKFASKDLFKTLARALTRMVMDTLGDKGNSSASLNAVHGAPNDAVVKDLVKQKIRAIFSTRTSVASPDDLAEIMQCLQPRS